MKTDERQTFRDRKQERQTLDEIEPEMLSKLIPDKEGWHSLCIDI